MLDEEAACSLYANETWIGKHLQEPVSTGSWVLVNFLNPENSSMLSFQSQETHHIVFDGRLLILLYESFILAAIVLDWFNLINATNL